MSCCCGDVIVSLCGASQFLLVWASLSELKFSIREFLQKEGGGWIKAEHQRIHRGIMGGGGGGVTHSLLSPEDPHSVWLCGLATNIVGSSVCVWGGGGGHSGGVQYVELGQASLNRTEVAQCILSPWMVVSAMS